MDGKGVKMSKSQWNAVAPGEITKKYGADIFTFMGGKCRLSGRL